MPRLPRLHLDGGIYYLLIRGGVMRGSARPPLVDDQADVEDLERLTALALERSRARVHAYCWLPRTLLLAVEVSDVPLGRLVQRITGPYAHARHARIGRSGHLFDGRYRALLIEPSAHLVDLVIHIHRAPVRAGLVAEPADYAWSGHRTYLGVAATAWLTTGVALGLLARRNAIARKRYRQLSSAAASDVSVRRFERRASPDPRILGRKAFIAQSQMRTRAPPAFASLEAVIEAVTRLLGVSRADLVSISRKRQLSLARAVIAWHATQARVATLREVAQRLNRDPSTLTVAIERYRRERPALFEVTKD